MKHQQTTLGKAIEMSGVGLHTGDEVTMRLSPAGADTGIVFIHHGRRLAASARFAQTAARNTTLSDGVTTLHTVEHVLATLLGFGVDNAEVELSAQEPPAMDGSALPFCRAIREAGIETLAAEKDYFIVPRPLFVEGPGGAAVFALPSHGPRVSAFISYDHPLIPSQQFDTTVGPKNFEEQIGPARTYAFIEEVEALRNAGLARGGSEENALVIYPDRYSSEPRFENEPVRHKALDLIGDMSLVGGRIIGHIIGYRSGHALNAMLAKKLAGC